MPCATASNFHTACFENPRFAEARDLAQVLWGIEHEDECRQVRGPARKGGCQLDIPNMRCRACRHGRMVELRNTAHVVERAKAVAIEQLQFGRLVWPVIRCDAPLVFLRG